MHLAVVHDDAYVAGIGTRQRSLFHLLHDTLEDGRHETGVYRTAHDGTVELQFAAPVEVVLFLVLHVERELLPVHLVLRGFGHAFVIGFDDQVHLPELSCTAGLFLVAVIGCRVW